MPLNIVWDTPPNVPAEYPGYKQYSYFLEFPDDANHLRDENTNPSSAANWIESYDEDFVSPFTTCVVEGQCLDQSAWQGGVGFPWFGGFTLGVGVALARVPLRAARLDRFVWPSTSIRSAAGNIAVTGYRKRRYRITEGLQAEGETTPQAILDGQYYGVKVETLSDESNGGMNLGLMGLVLNGDKYSSWLIYQQALGEAVSASGIAGNVSLTGLTKKYLDYKNSSILFDLIALPEISLDITAPLTEAALKELFPLLVTQARTWTFYGSPWNSWFPFGTVEWMVFEWENLAITEHGAYVEQSAVTLNANSRVAQPIIPRQTPLA